MPCSTGHTDAVWRHGRAADRFAASGHALVLRAADLVEVLAAGD